MEETQRAVTAPEHSLYSGEAADAPMDR